MYVCVYRMGGLGNQLFQYAAARAVADARGGKILVEKEELNAHNHLNHDYAALLLKDAEEVRSIQDKEKDAFHTFEQPGGAFGPWSIEHDLSKIPSTMSIRMIGYFQYLPAISNVLPSIRIMLLDALTLQRESMARKYQLTTHEEQHEAVFMHIRRGDYLNKADFHYVQDKTYYETAVADLRKKTKKTISKIFVLSNDHAWCASQQWSFEIEQVKESDELQCLALMSLCKGAAIIGNSSFSWWGAILADSTYVYRPCNWINETIYSLFPSHWKII